MAVQAQSHSKRPGHIPPSLRGEPRWAVWRYEERDGKRTKVPYRADGRKARVNRPEDWGPLEAALAALEKGGYDGLGLLLGGGVCGLDLDWKELPVNGELPPEARRLVEALGSYAEVSPSGKGLHILFRGALPEEARNRATLPSGVGVEVYAGNRFFTFTGERLEGSPEDLREVPPEVLAAALREAGLLKAKEDPRPSPTAFTGEASEEAVVEWLLRDPERAALWRGEWRGRYPSQSEADLALAAHLMWRTGNDLALADRLFRQSGLYRKKWDERHAATGKTYGQMTLERAWAAQPYSPEPQAFGRLRPHAGGSSPSPHPLDGLTTRESVDGTHPRYRVRGGRLEAARVEGRGESRSVGYFPLGNFAAVIRREVALTDGVEAEHHLELEGYLEDGTPLGTARVRASEFPGMAWLTREWGGRAVLFAGQGTKDHARAAIQLLSLARGYARAVVYRHLGWTRIDGRPVYLHAGGGIGPEGEVGGLEVEPGRALESFLLPPPPEGEEEREVWSRILALWPRLAPPEVAWPLLLYALQAALGHSPFALYLAGPTGARKTSLALVAQAFFAPGLEAPPLGWEATANALEGAAFAAKDALLLIDDFAPTGGEHQRKELQAKAARLIRSQGNATGRARMRADGTLAHDRPPRGSLLITGEDLPPGHSVRARTLVLEVRRGDVDLAALSEAQALARDGLLARATSAWIRHLAQDLDGHRKAFREAWEALRPQWAALGEHGRTADAGARLHAALLLLRGYLEGFGLALDPAPVLAALKEAVRRQGEWQKDADPVERFVPLLMGALTAGRGHLVDLAGWEEGEPPKDPHLWGWKWVPNTSGSPEAAPGRWEPRGPTLGWAPPHPEKDGVLLDPEAAYSVLARLAAETGEALPTPRTLWKRLGERGFLHVQYEQGGTRYLVVRRVGGGNRRVLHLRAEHLAPYISQKPVAPVAGEENPVQNGANPATGSLAATDFPVAGESPVGAQKGATEKPVAGEKPVAAETPSRTAQNGGATGATGFAEIYPPMGRVEEEEGEWL